VREACQRVAEGAPIYLVTADPTGLATPWYPIRAAIAAILGLPPVCSRAALTDAIAALGLAATDTPAIAELLGHSGELAQLEPKVWHRECVTAVMRVLALAAARSGRATLVFEDVDRYDRPSQDLLRRLASQPPGAGVQLLLTQTGAAPRWPAEVARLELGALDRAALRPLAEHAARANLGLDTLARLSGGAPGALEHVLHFLLEGADPSGAPVTIADLVAERAGRLPRNARVVLQAVATFGMEAQVASVRAVVAGQVAPEDVPGALRLLSGRGFVTVDAGLVAFTQPLLREVVYDATPADVRRELHAACSRLLEAEGAPAAVLGHHAERAGIHDLAIARLIVAAEDAARRSDDHGAARLLHRALDVARRTMLREADPEGERQFVELSVRLADALRAAGELALARGVVDEAMAVADERHPARGPLERVLGRLALAGDQAELAVGHLRRALQLAIRAGDAELIVELYLDLATAHLRSGDTDRALREVEEGLDVVTLGDGAAAEKGPRSLWRLLQLAAKLHRSGGRRAEALAAANHALRHADRAGSPVGRGRLHALLATLYEQERDFQAAARHRQCAIDELRRLGDRQSTAELLLMGTQPTVNLMRLFKPEK
jgi:tetratricopeptide (TPR) repeat protein